MPLSQEKHNIHRAREPPGRAAVRITAVFLCQNPGEAPENNINKNKKLINFGG